jgi:hypothetical protein
MRHHAAFLSMPGRLWMIIAPHYEPFDVGRRRFGGPPATITCAQVLGNYRYTIHHGDFCIGVSAL